MKIKRDVKKWDDYNDFVETSKLHKKLSIVEAQKQGIY